MLLNKNIVYNQNGLAYLTNLETMNAFSWGKTFGNMSYAFGEEAQVSMNLKAFLDLYNGSQIKNIVNIDAQSLDKIIDLDENYQSNNILTTTGFHLECDCIFTTLKGQTIVVKPADCHISIIEAHNIYGAVLGIVHSGYSGTSLKLPMRAIEHLIKKYNCSIESIKIGITPGILNYWLNKDVSFDQNLWKGFTRMDDQYVYFDILGNIISQYISSSIKQEQIFAYEVNTFENAKDGTTFSHRFSKLNNILDGRMVVAASL